MDKCSYCGEPIELGTTFYTYGPDDNERYLHLECADELGGWTPTKSTGPYHPRPPKHKLSIPKED